MIYPQEVGSGRTLIMSYTAEMPDCKGRRPIPAEVWWKNGNRAEGICPLRRCAARMATACWPQRRCAWQGLW